MRGPHARRHDVGHPASMWWTLGPARVVVGDVTHPDDDVADLASAVDVRVGLAQVVEGVRRGRPPGGSRRAPSARRRWAASVGVGPAGAGSARAGDRASPGKRADGGQEHVLPSAAQLGGDVRPSRPQQGRRAAPERQVPRRVDAPRRSHRPPSVVGHVDGLLHDDVRGAELGLSRSGRPGGSRSHTAVTSTPSARSSCTRAVPMPPVAPCTSTRSPAPTPVTRRQACA